MASLRDVRIALRRQLETISGLRAYDVWPSSINPPVAIVRPLGGDYHQTFDIGSGGAMFRLEVTVLLQLSVQGVAQEGLDEYVATDGPRSVIQAVECYPALGGCADNVVVRGWRDYGVMRVGADEEGRGADYLGCKFDVEVLL
jgi:hypothetical protein